MSEADNGYDYSQAFLRNLGFVTEAEQARLRNARVAIAGLGGTGGAQVHALARMGVGKFTLADPDVFELVNFNRQSGANLHTIGRRKTEVAEEVIKGINPEADVRLFDAGIDKANIEAFLEGADIIVDSLDFYCFEERFLLYRHARTRGLWVLTAPPLGYGFTLLVFDPKGMTFEDYFGFEPGMTERQRVVSLIAGIAPRPFLMRYLQLERSKLAGRQLPSVGAAPFLIAGVIVSEVVNLLTHKTRPIAVPDIYQFDALLRVFRRKSYPLGMRGPLQRLKKWALNKRLPQ